mmetsp:Transcript_141918/g.453426  ORF Transcript_141918/g.453426 Transcript_141918/m.453426 type:complete len:201 (-) Transcript_141918:147-749(-)
MPVRRGRHSFLTKHTKCQGYSLLPSSIRIRSCICRCRATSPPRIMPPPLLVVPAHQRALSARPQICPRPQQHPPQMDQKVHLVGTNYQRLRCQAAVRADAALGANQDRLGSLRLPHDRSCQNGLRSARQSQHAPSQAEVPCGRVSLRTMVACSRVIEQQTMHRQVWRRMPAARQVLQTQDNHHSGAGPARTSMPTEGSKQ